MARNYTGNTSLVIGIRVTAEDIKTGEITHTNTSYFTMVAKDENNKPTPVPPLILHDRDDIRRFVEAIVRKYNHQYFRDEMEKIKNNFNIQDEIEKLKDQRCIIDLKE